MTLETQCVFISLHLNIYFVSVTASDPSSWCHDVTGRSQDQTLVGAVVIRLAFWHCPGLVISYPAPHYYTNRQQASFWLKHSYFPSVCGRNSPLFAF